MTKEFVFDLSVTLEYAEGGDFHKTGTVIINKPSMDNIDETTEFNQLFMKAIMSSSRDSKKPEENEDHQKQPNVSPTASEIKMFLHASDRKEVKVEDIIKSFKKILLSSSDIGNKIKFTSSLINKLEVDDFMDMMCGYASFFSFPSLLKGE